jgi:ATP-dependent helicase HrpB
MLPVESVLPQLLRALSEHGVAVLEAPPGTGKTTRVPVAVADVFPGQTWVLEPRRIAARAAATRVSAERGEPVGAHVGYAMRFERCAGPGTRVLYVTEAMLTRRLVEDPALDGIGAVILDEFHERSLHADTALAWVRALRRSRPDLRLVVMSATLDGERLAAALGCQRVRAQGTLHPVDVRHQERKDDRPLEARVSAAVRAALADPEGGDVLVFLPGLGEIARCTEALGTIAADVVPLHGELDSDAQDRALSRPAAGSRGAAHRRRVILATNVAETSVTVEGVRTVIDAGLARVAGHDAWSGLGTLDLQPVSRASATQRAGRAGRLGPGVCQRLYTRAEFEARPADTLPEVLRLDLCGLALDLAAAGNPDLEWLDPPPPAAWRAASDLLVRLGAVPRPPNHRQPIDPAGTLTAIGRRMARMPVHPRVARVLVEAARLGAGQEGAAMAAAIGERGRREVVDRVDEALRPARGGRSDARARRQLEVLAADVPVESHPAVSEALAHALLAGFPDRVGRRRGGQVVLAEGGRAELDPATPGPDGVVVVSEAERLGERVVVRSLTPIPEDWLLDGAEVRVTMSWAGERVDVREQLRYGAIVLEDLPGRGDPETVAALLADHALPVAHRVFTDHARAEAFVARVAWLRRIGALPGGADLALPTLVRQACAGCRSFSDLGNASLVAVAHAVLGLDAARVDALAPEHVQLPGRARAPVTYPPDADPWVSSRMQDFFGLRDGPRIANGRPLVLQLLAPNQRPVQVTTDLPGFWERHWPGIRKELMRKYPRHKWPEDPRAAYVEAPSALR